MQRFRTSPKTTEPAPGTAEADSASALSAAGDSPAAAGQRLASAQSADRKWRAEFSRRLHQQLARILRSESLILRGGVGAGGVMLVAGLVTAILGASINVYMPLLSGAMFTSMGAVLLVMTIVGWEGHLRSTMTHLDVMEESEMEETAFLAPVPLFEGDKGKKLGKRLLWLAHLLVAGLVLWFVGLVVWIVASP